MNEERGALQSNQRASLGQLRDRLADGISKGSSGRKTVPARALCPHVHGRGPRGHGV